MPAENRMYLNWMLMKIQDVWNAVKRVHEGKCIDLNDYKKRIKASSKWLTSIKIN